ncbi:uncharacterized protein EDB93DRAFT_205974 [Suillus bovinus]|uniref:uncharacterized protein n=1 Tax=Suillus bovinus TaxID=48563 RepID=UPI001B877222|nr:uncharacterized protein EDB93DRAFT_205974 [Suillus bovinus]KAG2153632.1 hypothetical protein EDB93DRAFT_205974 [Suillus bovinus]
MRVSPYTHPRIIYNQSHHFCIVDILLAFHISIAISSLHHIIYTMFSFRFAMVFYNLLVSPTFFIELRNTLKWQYSFAKCVPFLVQCTMYLVTNFHDLGCICT